MTKTDYYSCSVDGRTASQTAYWSSNSALNLCFADRITVRASHESARKNLFLPLSEDEIETVKFPLWENSENSDAFDFTWRFGNK